MDNQIIGNEIITYLSQQLDTSDLNLMLNSLQNICEELMLPNGGFICVMNEHGELLAAPGIDQMPEPNLNIVEFTDFELSTSLLKEDLRSTNPLTGILNYQNGQKTDIIASLALGSTNLRLNVHQNMSAALQNTKKFFKGFFLIALLVALGVALIGFLILNMIIAKYESRIEKQAAIIEQKNIDHLSSLKYASFLQKSYLPGRNILSDMFPESFVFLQPRDIVSGDFFYVKETKENKFFSVIDCTGHGVPGSLLSMIGYGLLEQAIMLLDDPDTSQILEYLCKKFPEALSGNQDFIDTDGMDMGICALDKKTGKLSYSGAKNPLFLVRNKEVIKYTGDKFSIGQNAEHKTDCFTKTIIDLEEGDMLYMTTDGIIDQFGGPNNKKFMSKNFRNLISDIASLPIDQQYLRLENTLKTWKGDLPQIDDITIMGIRV